MNTQNTLQQQHYSVAAIENGTVIDHIPAGKAILLLRLLKLNAHRREVTVGINLPSTQMVSKDIIKVSGWELSSQETSQIAIFAPRATISIIQNYRVVNKYVVKIPPTIDYGLVCPNPHCITNYEKAISTFYVESHRKEIRLRCKFCEKTFLQHEITNHDCD